MEQDLEVSSQKSKSFLGLSIILASVIILIICILAYLYYSKIVVLSSSIEEECTNTCEEENQVKYGKFSINLTYPSEFFPPIRVCFINATDSEKVYCFIQKSENNLLKEDSLPVGDYYMELAEVSTNGLVYSDSYVWNDCTSNISGSETDDQSKCSLLYEEWNKREQEGADGCVIKDSLVNNPEIGGKPVTISIDENKVTNLGNVSVLPYFDYSSSL